MDLIRTRQSHAMMKTMGDHSATQIRLQQAVEGFSTFVISYYAMGLLEIMLEAGIAAKLLEVNPKIVLGVAAPIVFFSVWALTRWTRKRVTRASSETVRLFTASTSFHDLDVHDLSSAYFGWPLISIGSLH